MEKSVHRKEKHMPSPIDFHTHDMAAQAGTAILNLTREQLLRPETFRPAANGLYSAGIHPWWTDADTAPLLAGLEKLLPHPSVVAVGECGFDRLRGGSLSRQLAVFEKQISLAGKYSLPVTIHCVRAFDLLLKCAKQLRPATRWTVHGFRGRPALARQLLDAGFDLSFGPHFNPASLRLVPPSRRRFETDDSGIPFAGIMRRAIAACESSFPSATD